MEILFFLSAMYKLYRSCSPKPDIPGVSYRLLIYNQDYNLEYFNKLEYFILLHQAELSRVAGVISSWLGKGKASRIGEKGI